MAWTIEWLRSWDAVWHPEHLARWHAALAAAGDLAPPFMHPAPVRAWLDTMGGEAALDPFFLVASHDDGHRVLWPLVRASSPALALMPRRLVVAGGSAIGAAQLFDYHDPIIAPAAGTRWEAVAPGFWAAFEAACFSRSDPGFDGFAARLRSGTCAPQGEGPPAGAAPFLRLDRHDGSAAFLMSRRIKFRSAVRRAVRRLSEKGEVAFRVHVPDDARDVLACLPQLEAARLERYRKALPEGYLARLVVEGAPSGVVHCTSLALEGEPVAWNVSFFLNGTYYGYLQGFDRRHSGQSPGVVHLFRLIEWLFERRARRFDFLIGEEGYKADWTDGEATRLQTLTHDRHGAASALRRTSEAGLSYLQRRQRGLKRKAGRLMQALGA
ncbi:hypothetical protein BH23PSE1_BH23PSE1_00550 [soil metagenome]